MCEPRSDHRPQLVVDEADEATLADDDVVEDAHAAEFAHQEPSGIPWRRWIVFNAPAFNVAHQYPSSTKLTDGSLTTFLRTRPDPHTCVATELGIAYNCLRLVGGDEVRVIRTRGAVCCAGGSLSLRHTQ